MQFRRDLVLIRDISQEICDIYRSSPAEQLLKSSHDRELKALAKAINQDIEKYMQQAIKRLPQEVEDDQEEDDKEEIGIVDGVVVAEDKPEQTEKSHDLKDSNDYREQDNVDMDGTVQPNEANMEDVKEQDVEFHQYYKEELEDSQEESEDEQCIPAHTEISLFQKYLQHPLFNDD